MVLILFSGIPFVDFRYPIIIFVNILEGILMIIAKRIHKIFKSKKYISSLKKQWIKFHYSP